ncbi:MAG: three-Cys-motif partner protein TcmP [Ignavibacteria bacterium]|nr:three-Cys-motif partner protein TcmP [Ignavibacteria bacterium]
MGGPWTEEKLDAFQKYVDAYLKIMHSTRAKHNGWPYEIIYFDGFAGSGQRILKESVDKNKKLQFEDYLTEETQVYEGSAERVLKLDKKFDKYYFIDIDEGAINTLKERLSEKGLINDKCYFHCGDVNKYIKLLVSNLDKNKVALILLDPFGMQVDWKSIEIMKGKRIDL